MRAWLVIAALLGSLSAFAGDDTSIVIHGKLVQPSSGPVTLRTPQGSMILEADKDSDAVLHDARLAGSEMEIHGHVTSPGHFQINPFHTKAIFVVKDGKKQEVTYWCDICSIRTYTPGRCVCCQQETKLDLRDPD